MTRIDSVSLSRHLVEATSQCKLHTGFTTPDRQTLAVATREGREEKSKATLEHELSIGAVAAELPCFSAALRSFTSQKMLQVRFYPFCYYYFYFIFTVLVSLISFRPSGAHATWTDLLCGSKLSPSRPVESR